MPPQFIGGLGGSKGCGATLEDLCVHRSPCWEKGNWRICSPLLKLGEGLGVRAKLIQSFQLKLTPMASRMSINKGGQDVHPTIKVRCFFIWKSHVFCTQRKYFHQDLPKIMHFLNWYTAMCFNRMLNRTGHFWEKRYYCDGFAPTDTQRALNTLRYIHGNPKAAQMRQSFFYDFSNYGISIADWAVPGIRKPRTNTSGTEIRSSKSRL